jgi:HD-like signal output (HDOD) protein
VKLAITLVGIRTIKNFTLWSAVFSLMPNPKCGPFDLKSLWQDSLRRALFARLAGQFQGIKDADDLFAAALLQDMAVPLLAKELPKEYVDLLEDRDGGRQRLSTLEQNKFGWDHAEAAAMMARAWDLPEELAGPIETHTEIESLIASGKATPHALAVALSSLLPPSVDEQWVEWGRFQTAYQAVCPKGGPAIAEVLRQVDEGFVEFAPVLQMSTPARTLVDALQQAQ